MTPTALRSPPRAARPAEPELGRLAPLARRRRLLDRTARWTIFVGGMGIIASVLGILLFILLEAAPLLAGAKVTIGPVLDVGRVSAAVCDEYRSHVVGIGDDGVVRVHRTADGANVLEARILPPEDAGLPLVRPAASASGRFLCAGTRDGRVAIVPVGWDVAYRGSERDVRPLLGDPVLLEMDPLRRAVETFAVRMGPEGDATVVARLPDATFAIARRTTRENLLTGERVAEVETIRAASAPEVTALRLDGDGTELFAGTPAGELLWWSLDESGLGAPRRSPEGGSPVSALALLVGERALVVGREDGSISVWFPISRGGEAKLFRARDFEGPGGPVRSLAPSPRDRSFLALGEAGRLALYHSTSHRRRWTGASPRTGASGLFYAPKADGAVVAGGGGAVLLDIDNAHPEISLATLFGPVRYEGYEEETYVWQSTGYDEEFEPKFSLVPLLVGTLKGTFYSLLLAIPLGILGALYVSQFMHPSYVRFVKPAIEIMAALPSVVLGFVAGLWLAPRVEEAFPGLLLAAAAIPAFFVLGGAVWRRLPEGFRGRFPDGTEAFFQVFVLAAGLALCFPLGRPLEALLFGGDFSAWLYQATGWRYDQRNAIVVGLAMGFAVIPIVFSIAEDAFSNVPRHLVSASLALGASRWQTAWRVVVPAASAGVFSAVMIGFGRAVGETMIVLMATGNTPILDWDPFRGFRTLSANIAVEIPEAPHGGSLYRTLFLSGLLLFVFTFLANTGAELLRTRLRRRTAQL